MNTLIRRTDPRRADQIRSEARSALRQSVGTRKRLAVAGGFDVTRGSHLLNDDESIVTRYHELAASIVEAGGSIYPLISVLEVHACGAVKQLGSDALVALFWKLMGDESHHEGHENHHQSLFAYTGDLGSLLDAIQIERGCEGQFCAVISELIVRGVDPRVAAAVA